MARLRIPHIVISGIALIAFIAMIIGSSAYAPQTAWFPLYTGMAGVIVSGTLVIMGLIAVRRQVVVDRAREDEPREQAMGASQRVVAVDSGSATVTDLIKTGQLSEPATTDVIRTAEQNDQSTLLQGYGWLLLWLAYLIAILLIGFLIASLAMLGIWFRRVVWLPWWGVAIVVVAVGAFLLAAGSFLGMAMPGGWGWLGSLVGLR